MDGGGEKSNSTIKRPLKERLNEFLRSHELKLYCSYSLSTWGNRLWSFGLGLALVEIGGNLRLTGISGLLNCAAVFLFASVIGRWIDRSHRLRAARLILTCLNGSVAVSATSLVCLLIWRDTLDSVWNGHLTSICIGLACILCAVSVLASSGMKILLCSDWAVEISEGAEKRLTAINAMMLRIDLCTMIISPLVVGELMSAVSLSVGCGFIVVWNILSWPLEFYFLKVVYDNVPSLGTKVLPSELEDQSSKGISNRISSALKGAASSWIAYGRQSVLGAAVAMALLYMTILSFDQVTNGYVYSEGVPENIIALAQGVGSLSGILGTVLFPWLRKKVGLRLAGLIALSMELVCLSPSVLSIWLDGSPFDPGSYFSPTASPSTGTKNYTTTEFTPTTADDSKHSMVSVIVLLASIVSARCGLWMADLAITQLMQQAADPVVRGGIFGVQSGLQQLASMIKNALAIALPEPATFGILILASFSCIATALLTYVLFLLRNAVTKKEVSVDESVIEKDGSVSKSAAG